MALVLDELEECLAAQSDIETIYIAESNANVSDGHGNQQEEPESYIESESYVDVSLLLASKEGIEEQSLAFARIEIGEYTALYYKVASMGSDILRESIGNEMEAKNGIRLNWETIPLFYAKSGESRQICLQCLDYGGKSSR